MRAQLAALVFGMAGAPPIATGNFVAQADGGSQIVPHPLLNLPSAIILWTAGKAASPRREAAAKLRSSISST